MKKCHDAEDVMTCSFNLGVTLGVINLSYIFYSIDLICEGEQS